MAATRTGVIGVLCTAITAQGELYRRVLARYAQNVQVITMPSPRLVDLAERGWSHDDEALAIIREVVDPINAAGADQIVLACTHFPFLEPLIRRTTSAELVDPAPGIARQTGRVLPVGSVMSGTTIYLTTGEAASMNERIRQLVGASAGEVRAISLTE